MTLFLAILIMMTTSSVALFIIVKNARNMENIKEKNRLILTVLSVATLLLFCDLLYGGQSLELRLALDILMSIFPLLVVSSSVWDDSTALKIGWCLVVPAVIMIVVCILQLAGILPVFPSVHYVMLIGLVAICISFQYALALSLRIREIRLVMNSGNVWSSVCMMTDVLYLLSLIIELFVLFMSLHISGTSARVIVSIVSFLLTLELVALVFRISMNSLFVIWRRHERRIVESMKISYGDRVNERSKTNDIYRDIYVRIVNYFENEKPYLNSELTINDVVKVIFTNKLYISKAISQFTGRNFCQFVNYYRVSYSIQLFRANPDLKVVEMATQSGFNSTVSFSMAFRLYMSECPSDWCRKEKLKLVNRKK